MWSFIRTFFATLLALIVIIVLFFVGIGAMLAGFQTKDIVPLADNSVIIMSLDKPIHERGDDNPFENLDLPISSKSKEGLLEIKESIKRAKTDEKIKGILLNLTSIQAGLVTISEVRQALMDFKTSGKFIYAYSEYISEKSYYLASVADSIFMNPSGLMEFNGLSTEYMFLKGTLEKLELKPEIFKVGAYKSAVEPLLFDKMSPASKEQTSSYLTSIQHTLYQTISNSRKISLEELNHISDSMLVHKPIDAKRLGLIDDVLYYDQVEALMQKRVGVEKVKDLHTISYQKYENRLSTSKEDEEGKKSDTKIAVIIGQGDIGSGKGDDESIGSEKIAEELRMARRDDKVKAIVLRINSPGGSSLASDVMWREVKLAAETKPVIASMGDVAASGGYYMAMAADTIVAEPHTITGSIGVFGVMINAQEFFKNKLGITFDGVKTGKFSDILTPYRPMTDFERKIVQKEVEDIYEDFVQKASEGRKMSKQDVLKVASGRVWTGEQAKKNGLVDVLGNLDDAIHIAAASAHLGENYEIEYLPKKKDFFEKLMHDFQDKLAVIFSNTSATFVLESTYQRLVKKYNGMQARMPFELHIQ